MRSQAGIQTGVYRLKRAVVGRFKVAWFSLLNCFSTAPLVAVGGPVVSLTTYGSRLKTVHLVLEAIARGEMLPSRCILWLDDPSLMSKLPKALDRLKRRGLEIKLSENYGPHTKYYPYLLEAERLDEALVTADDDVLYPRFWLKELHEAHREFPAIVNCHRVRIVTMREGKLCDYGAWQLGDTTDASRAHFILGVGGVIYPPRFQQHLRDAGAAFLTCCPKADDIWLHVQALRAGYQVRQVNAQAFALAYIPGTQITALHYTNVAGGENNQQIGLTYQPSDLAQLRTACGEAASSSGQTAAASSPGRKTC